jgi:hypothetical protein
MGLTDEARKWFQRGTSTFLVRTLKPSAACVPASDMAVRRHYKHLGATLIRRVRPAMPCGCRGR